MADVKTKQQRVGLYLISALLLSALLLAGVLLGPSLFPPSERPEAAAVGGTEPVAPPAAEREALRLPELPERFAGLQLVSSYSGPAAVRDILRLHRNEFPLLDGLIAEYAGEAEVTVWVSLSPTVEEAARLMQKMVETMPASTVFQEESVFTLEGRQIYHVTGMGLDHYYYHEGLFVYWLAVGRTAAPQEVLAAFLQSL